MHYMDPILKCIIDNEVRRQWISNKLWNDKKNVPSDSVSV